MEDGTNRSENAQNKSRKPEKTGRFSIKALDF
jgi:hypothetical protein